jgi:hypothetical protein
VSDELLLDYDALTGMRQWISTDDSGNSFIRYEQDVSAILDANKERQNEGFDKRDDMWHAAHVPDIVQMEWKTKHGVEMWNPDHKPAVMRLLNSNEYRHLRVKHFII